MALKEIVFRNFSGGVNSRDAASELAENEMPDALNVTIDERGGLQKRLGYINRYTNAVGSGLVSNLFYWSQQAKIVQQIGTGMHLDDAASFHTWSTSARVGMCEFLGNLVMIHPVDGMKIYDGASVTTPTNAPTGNTCWPWQNRVWSGGDSSPRLYYSDIGSANRTSVNQFNDIREKDSEGITCIVGAAGQDISGRPGLIVFKQDSAYRVYDAGDTPGAYTTLDVGIGCASNIGAVVANGRIYTIHPRGIWSTDGLNPFVEQSQLIENFFHKDQVNHTRPDLFAAGRYQDKLYFSLPIAGETANSKAIELHSLQNWVMPHSNAASCYTSVEHGNLDLVMGSPSVAGRAYTSHKGGTDAGTAIASRMQTRWIEPNNGNKVRVRRARFIGYGEFDATLLRDYEVDQSLRTLDVEILSDAGVYDDGDLYDSGVLYGPTKFQDKQDFWHIGVGRAISFKISETSSISNLGRPILGGSISPEIGAWNLSHINALCIDLGTR